MNRAEWILALYRAVCELGGTIETTWARAGYISTIRLANLDGLGIDITGLTPFRGFGETPDESLEVVLEQFEERLDTAVKQERRS